VKTFLARQGLSVIYDIYDVYINLTGVLFLCGYIVLLSNNFMLDLICSLDFIQEN